MSQNEKDDDMAQEFVATPNEVKVPTIKCVRCGYEYVPKKSGQPNCPKCRGNTFQPYKYDVKHKHKKRA